MKSIFKIASLFLLALLVFIPAQPAAAKGALDGQVVFGRSYTLASGSTLNGDLVVFGGAALLQENSTVNGSVVIIGGSLVANGTVTRDVVVTGGSVVIGAAAHIHGNLSTVGASLDRANGSLVDGQVFNTVTSAAGNGQSGTQPLIPGLPQIPLISTPRFNFNPFGSLLNAFGQALGLAVLAMLVMLFLAPHADRVAHAMFAQPLVAGSLGLLTAIATPFLLILMVFTLILIPVIPIVLVALVVAAVFGWIALGYEIGQRFTRAIHQEWHPAFSAGLGVFVLTLVADALTGIPLLNCVGWLVPTLLGLAALGAVIMTRFGTQPVSVPASRALAPIPTVPAEPLPPESPASAAETVTEEPKSPSKKR